MIPGTTLKFSQGNLHKETHTLVMSKAQHKEEPHFTSLRGTHTKRLIETQNSPLLGKPIQGDPQFTLVRGTHTVRATETHTSLLSNIPDAFKFKFNTKAYTLNCLVNLR